MSAWNWTQKGISQVVLLRVSVCQLTYSSYTPYPICYYRGIVVGQVSIHDGVKLSYL